MPPNGKSILIAEDNPAMSEVIRFNLERAGFLVTVCGNGEEAWQTLQAQRFDAIVTDQQMPGMNGEELCEKVRTDRRFQGTPIIMLTAKGLELDVADLRRRLGIAHALHKPFSPKELIDQITDCLEQIAQTTSV